MSCFPGKSASGRLSCIREFLTPQFSSIECSNEYRRLCDDNFFSNIPSILVCGRGYPSVSTRVMTSRLAQELGVPVVGLADYNPHGLALLQAYRRGGIHTSLEANGLSIDVKWLGLRASQLDKMDWIGDGEALTDRDVDLVESLRAQSHVSSDPRYLEEVEAMHHRGKYELQCLYGHHSGTKYFCQEFLPTSLLQHDYI